MPKVVPEYKDIAKKKILDVAYSIFYKKGYHDSTMEDIAKEVGVSKASLYSYFKSKDEILQTTSNQNLNESFNHIFEDGNSLESLEMLYNNMINFKGALHLNFEITALSSHNKNIRTINRDLYEKKLDILTKFVEKQQDNDNIRKDIDALTIAQLITAVYSDIAMQLIIGIDITKVYEFWKNSISAITKKNDNDYDQQKTLNKYFAHY